MRKRIIIYLSITSIGLVISVALFLRPPSIEQTVAPAYITTDWSPDGRKIAVGGSIGLQIFTNDLNSLLFNLEDLVVTSLAWSSDSDKIAIVSLDNRLSIRNSKTFELLTTPDISSRGISTAEWGPKGTRIALSGSNEGVQILEIADYENTLWINESSSSTSVIAWHPFAQILATGSETGTVSIWDTIEGTKLSEFTLTDRVSSLSWSPDGSRLAVAGGDQFVRVWGIERGVVLLDFLAENEPHSVSVIAFSPDNSHIATAGSAELSIWDAENGQKQASMKGHKMAINALAWSPDSTRVVTASVDESVRIWDISKETPIAIYQH